MRQINFFEDSSDLYSNESIVSLKIHQKFVGGVGCVVWDAALVLLKYLFTKNGNKHVKHNCVLELGAGTGVVGIASFLAGAESVIITDLPECLPLMELNVQENRAALYRPCVSSGKDIEEKVLTRVLRWGDEKDINKIYNTKNGEVANDISKIKCVLIADCIYYEEGMMKLYDTIVLIMNEAHQDCHILCCYEYRNTPEKVKLLQTFIHLLKVKSKFDLSFVKQQDMDEEYNSPDIHIMIVGKA